MAVLVCGNAPPVSALAGYTGRFSFGSCHQAVRDVHSPSPSPPPSRFGSVGERNQRQWYACTVLVSLADICTPVEL